MLSPEESRAAPGPYRERTEPTATIIHQFLTDPRYRVFIGKKPSRMGYTLQAFIGAAWWLAHNASDIVFCIDDQRQVKKIAKKRLIPLLKSIKILADIMPANLRSLTSVALYFKGITMHLGGARSIADVTSFPAGLVIGDEVDQWKDFASGEASAFWHLLDRIMDVPGGKAIFFGKPRNETDLLHTQFLTGTRHQCFVPCPHCGHMQPLLWENLKFDHCRLENGNYDLERVKREVYYLCASPACQQSESKGIIAERFKQQMILAHEWRQTYFGDDPDYQLDPEKMSIVPTSHLYSLRPNLNWGEVAKHFITARKEGGAALAHFFRTRFGEPERQAQAVTKKEEITKLSGYITTADLQKWWNEGHPGDLAGVPRTRYRHGHCPFVPADNPAGRAIFMFCDVQTVLKQKKWVKMAFSDTGQAAVIDYGIYMSFNSLIEEANKPVIVDDWGDTPEAERVNPLTTFCWIDEGGTTTGTERNEIEVREFCARPDTFGRFFPSKGAGGGQIASVVEEKEREVTDEKTGQTVTIAAYHFSHDTFATELFLRRIKKHDEILLALAQGVDPDAQPLWLPEFPDDQFVTEMCSVVQQKQRIRGRWEYVWAKVGARVNDFPDGVQGCLAEWHTVKADYLRAPEPRPPEPSEPPVPEFSTGRDYILHRQSR